VNVCALPVLTLAARLTVAVRPAAGMPKLLLVSLIAAVGILGVDVVRVLWWEDPGWWRVVVVAIDLAAMALFASLGVPSEHAA
jgi:hypothetical protein